jgi:hypothetical protein
MRLEGARSENSIVFGYGTRLGVEATVHMRVRLWRESRRQPRGPARLRRSSELREFFHGQAVVFFREF